MTFDFTICGLHVKARHINDEIDILDVDGDADEPVSDRDIMTAAREEWERMCENWRDGWLARHVESM